MAVLAAIRHKRILGTLIRVVPQDRISHISVVLLDKSHIARDPSPDQVANILCGSTFSFLWPCLTVQTDGKKEILHRSKSFDEL